MNKYFCDRCGAEIGEEKHVERWVHLWKVCGEWCKISKDLCQKCNEEVTAFVYNEPDGGDT